MCKRVGVNYEDIDFERGDWYTDHEWTWEQENEFTEWLIDYFYNNTEAREELFEFPRKNKKHCRSVAHVFQFQYGWKIKEEE